jgi:hypothetical protein
VPSCLLDHLELSAFHFEIVAKSRHSVFRWHVAGSAEGACAHELGASRSDKLASASLWVDEDPYRLCQVRRLDRKVVVEVAGAGEGGGSD